MPNTRESSAPVMFTLWSELFENQRRYTARLLAALRGSTNTQSAPVSPTPPIARAMADGPDSAVETGSGGTARKARSVSEFPIKRYDTMTVPEIAAKLDRLQDRHSIRTVLAHEAKNTARKGVAAAGEARLEYLRDQ